MIQRRGGVSSVFGAGAACAMLSGCLMQVVPVAQGDAAVNDATPVVDAAMPTPDAAMPTPDVTPAVDGAMPTPDAVTPTPDAPTPDPAQGAGSVDLLVVVDDSNSMTRGQDYLAANINQTVMALLQRNGVRDVRVGVVSTDLGTSGSTVPSCMGPRGDDGLLNPRVRGAATSARTLPRVEGGVFCEDEMLLAQNYITVSTSDDGMAQYWRPTCQLRLGTGGCGIEQQLEAARRALITHGGAGGANAGFLRRDAALAILILTDEEDGSVRDCAEHDGIGACDDARSVFDITSSRWASYDMNLRFYNYEPGGAQDPTWPLERYVDPSRPTRGFLGLKPGHPERVLFAAITGVPIAVPRTASGATDWDALLGTPAAGRPDDFNARDASRAFADPMNASGPISMRQHDADPMCASRLIPACRQHDTAPVAACDQASQPFAWRARRIAEVARRFDQSALCSGAACGNGMVASICGDNDGTPFARFADMIARRVVR